MPKGKKSGGGGASDMDFVEGDDDDDPTAMLPASPAPKAGVVKFNRSAEKEDGTWQPSGELRKKKGGKNWKKRWCHLVRGPVTVLSTSHLGCSCLPVLRRLALLGGNKILVRSRQKVP